MATLALLVGLVLSPFVALLIAIVALLAVLVGPGKWCLAAIAVAPLHAYRTALPGELGNASLFRVCVLAGTLALVLRLWRHRARAPADTGVRTIWLALFAIGVFEAYQGFRGLTPLGWTSALAFCSLALGAGFVATTILLGFTSLWAASVAAVCSAIAPLAYLAFQVVSPGTGVEKYGEAVPLTRWLGARAGSDQARGGGLTTGGAFRPASLFSDPNFLAIFAVGTIVLGEVALEGAHGHKFRLGIRLVQAASVAAVVLTLSRTGLVVLALAAGWIALRYLRRPTHSLRRLVARFANGRLTGLTATTSAVMVGGLVLAATGFLLVSSRSTAGSTQDHLTTVLQAIELWQGHPLNGVGLGNFGYVFGQAQDRSSAQSFPFTVLSEQGVIGIALLGAVFWYLTQPLMTLRRPLGGLVIVILVGMWLYDFVVALDVVGVWVGLLAAEARAKPADSGVSL